MRWPRCVGSGNLLVEDLGVDPGPEMQNLERAVLAQDPGLLSSPSPEPVPVPVRRPSAMPRPLSSFVGRAFELLVLADTARQARLVTLVGTAGCGKTRLAVEYANGCADEDGPWLVRLADVQDPTLVPMAFVEPLGLASVAGAPLAAVTQAMTTQRGLLLVDNCEHVSAAAAESIRELLDACPDIRVLATSREPLGVDGERLLPLAPLEVSTDHGDGPAVALFIDRATQVRPGWSPDQAELELIRSICRELDGIPLALELAAARARVLSVAELAALLHDRFAAVEPVPRAALTPHTTLEAAIAWSVALLPPAERALFDRLWVFEGGFSLDAVDAVRPDGVDALTATSGLVTRSVVVADTSSSPTRYRMLETVRAYARRHAARGRRWTRTPTGSSTLRNERRGSFVDRIGNAGPPCFGRSCPMCGLP